MRCTSRILTILSVIGGTLILDVTHAADPLRASSSSITRDPTTNDGEESHVEVVLQMKDEVQEETQQNYQRWLKPKNNKNKTIQKVELTLRIAGGDESGPNEFPYFGMSK